MRKEKEMMDLILNTAKSDDRIKAVYMNGSRTNSNAVKDIFQDYDIVYVVDSTKPFIDDKKWIDRFGERLFIQYPDENPYYEDETNKQECYGWLMQFADGNRLDLHVVTLKYAEQEVLKDKLCIVLLDKEGILPDIPKASDEDHYVKRPTQKEFLAICNEFWWCLDNVAKGLWREEPTYAMDMLNYCVRPQLIKLLSWKIGINNDFKCSIGKSGKYMYRYLSENEWNKFLETYSSADVDDIWNAVMKMCSLFIYNMNEVSKGLGYECNIKEAENCMGYLKHVRQLPKDAEDIY